jgi:hypothetical protein
MKEFGKAKPDFFKQFPVEIEVPEGFKPRVW